MTGGGATTTAACRATCVIVSETTGNINQVIGILTLTQVDVNHPTRITGTLSGLAPGKHGITICTYGDMSQGATSCGPIFNPFGKSHGSPQDGERMVGDLGNIVADENQRAIVDISDKLIQLLGPHSIIGRSLVVYAGEDDRGRGGHENSLSTGNAGPRIGSGIVGLSSISSS